MEMKACKMKRRGGFTLTELLVAVVLAMIITGIVATVFGQASRLFSRSDALVKAMNNARVAMDFIEKDLQGAFLEANGVVFLGEADAGDLPPEWALPAEANYWETPPDQSALIFLTTPVLAYQGEGTDPGPRSGARVTYYVTADNELIRVSQADDTTLSSPGTAPWPSPFDYKSRVVAFGVRSFKVSYYSARPTPIWTDTWDSCNQANLTQYRRLPDAVMVELEVVDSEKGVLDPDKHPGAEPFTLSRTIRVGTSAPAQ